MTASYKTAIYASILLAIVACGGPATEPLPTDLIQIWRNPAPGYKDHYFEVREGWVLFGTGKFDFRMHPIETVRLEQGNRITEITIEYRAEDGGAVPLYLAYTPGSPPHLRIGMREDRWIPEQFAGWLKDEDS